MDDVTARRWAGVIVRSVRARAGLSQRQLAAKAGLSPSTVARIEADPGTLPSWATMTRAVSAGGCVMWPLVDGDFQEPVEPWEFDHVRDLGDRHLPSHLAVWQLRWAWEWSSFHKYSSYVNPPFPDYSYRLRQRSWPQVPPTDIAHP